ncbi:hypothetical protein E2C01_011637 [Portunus trituberculatus]|uniref:Uncharacterized protein n=1 Tax=Portunus trituberculatus TaxID=210409 RepID=A0A5B7DBU3_PORTR|nr:hypothetical protein [Portunus trituberculatus]
MILTRRQIIFQALHISHRRWLGEGREEQWAVILVGEQGGEGGMGGGAGGGGHVYHHRASCWQPRNILFGGALLTHCCQDDTLESPVLSLSLMSHIEPKGPKF